MAVNTTPAVSTVLTNLGIVVGFMHFSKIPDRKKIIKKLWTFKINQIKPIKKQKNVGEEWIPNCSFIWEDPSQASN